MVPSTPTKRQYLITVAACFLLAATVSGEDPEVLVSAPATTPLLAIRGPAPVAQTTLLGLGARAAVPATPALAAEGAAGTTVPHVDATSATAGAAETLRILDTDHSGSIGSTEIEAFAKEKGVDINEVRAEFASFDKNGNGALEAAEIASTLAEPEVARSGPHLGTSDASTVNEGHPVDLMTNVARRASRGAAEIFARKAATSLAQRAREGTAAEDLEALARRLRLNATMLSRGAPAAAALAASAAAKKVLKKSAIEAKALTTKAEANAQKAAAERQKASAAMQRALKAQMNMTSSVASLSGSPPDLD